MPKMRLTEKVVARLPAPDPTGKQVLYWDEELRGFGVLCSGKTSARSYVVQRNLPDGRNRRLTVAAVNETTLKEARATAAAILLDMRRGVDPKAKGGTLRQVLDDYLEANSRLREKSRAAYSDSVLRYLAPWLDRQLSEISAAEVADRHRTIAAEVRAGGRYSGEASANLTMRSLRVLWNFAAERDADMPANPVRVLRRQWFPAPRRERMVRSEDLPRFCEGVRGLANPIHRDYLLLLLFTGLRRREAARLTWADVDFAAGAIRVPAASTKAGRKLDLPMTDVVRDILVRRQEPGRERYVFPSSSKSRHIEEPRFALKQVAAATGVQVSVHDLRRTFITVAESADISPMALKALVNHSLGSGVTEGYVQMSVERLREPAQRVCDRMRALSKIAISDE